jgi:hypothetical protein
VDSKKSTAALGSISAPKAGVTEASTAAPIILRMCTVIVSKKVDRQARK